MKACTTLALLARPSLRRTLLAVTGALSVGLVLLASLRFADNATPLSAAILLLALLMCGLSFWIVVRLVLRPVEEIVAAFTGAIQGQIATPTESPDAELMQLGEVLSAFQVQVQTVRLATEQLEDSRRELSAVIDNAIDGLITIDTKGVIQSFNPACERLFGHRADEIIGCNISALMPAPYRDEHDGYLAHYAGSGQACAIGASGRELLGQRKDGSIFPIDLSVSGISLAGKNHFSGIIRDITARKKTEKSIAAHILALERSNRELDDFAYIASHDLKEPLRGIENHARFLLEDNEKLLDEPSVRRIDRLLQLSQRMERLVNDLLYFSRLGRQELAVQPTNLGALIHDIEQTLEHFLTEAGVRTLAPRPLPTIVCDKPRVAELFRNLITNAVKHNNGPDKIVEIGVFGQRLTPAGTLARRVFYVRDNGPGIPAEYHEEVFRIFKRLKPGEVEGTGVGLTFVKKIVERHDGVIWIESAPGEGAMFCFTLEINDDREHAKAA